MTLVKRNRLGLGSFGFDMDELLEGFFKPSLGSYLGDSQARPAWNLVETEDGFELEAEVPGYSSEDLEISLEEDTLCVRGKIQEKEERKGRYQRRERFQTSFERQLRLPGAVDADAVQAELENGVLRLMLPKVRVAKPRKIAING